MAVLLAEDFTSPAARQRQLKAGKIVALGRGIWTDETAAAPEEVTARRWREILARTMPGAVVTYRSGFAMRPVNGELFVSHPTTRSLVLAGLTIYPDGHEDHRRPDDVPLDPTGLVFGASRARALVDNAEQRGRPGRVRRRLSAEELHEQVANIVTTSTPRQLENMLAQIDEQANRQAATSIRAIVDAARGVGPALPTDSHALAAAQRGERYDHARVALFRQVASALSRQHLVQRYVNDEPRAAFVPFYEAYFSNYIEGSTLTISEAERVVFDKAEVGKPDDAHDISATWEIVSDVEEMSQVARDADDFMEMLRGRHATMMAAHRRKGPGQWKTEEVSAGATVFVHPDLVPGTLRAGWEIGAELTDPFQRAVYMMFLVSEVHPFLDGNGRSARVAMNAELVPHHMHRIIVPTVLRNDYVSGLVRATAGNGPEGLYRVLDYAQRWVAIGEFADLPTAHRYLRVTNATVDSGVAAVEGIHLKILRPGELFELPDAEHYQPTTLTGENLAPDVFGAIAAPTATDV